MEILWQRLDAFNAGKAAGLAERPTPPAASPPPAPPVPVTPPPAAPERKSLLDMTAEEQRVAALAGLPKVDANPAANKATFAIPLDKLGPGAQRDAALAALPKVS